VHASACHQLREGLAPAGRVYQRFSAGGGNLAAALALLARDNKDLPRLRLQLLIGPNLDARFVPLAADLNCNLRDGTSYDSLRDCVRAVHVAQAPVVVPQILAAQNPGRAGAPDQFVDVFSHAG
jgi:hypothetical protein